jgi:endonuclease/exonuclease/phosphatase family metal-dependent hydrolase
MTNKQKAIASIATVGIIAALYSGNTFLRAEKHVLIATWNVRGYPETEQDRQDWFSDKLIEFSPDIICVQEIANQDRIDKFLANEEHFTSAAFLNSSDGQDNAIFAAEWVEIEDIPDPNGFQHPAQAAYVAYKGFDAVIITVHLSWTDVAMREQEKSLLEDIVSDMLQKDPDVIIAGDFNTKEQGIQELADSIGMRVMVPLEQDGVGTTHAGNRYDHFLISPDLANEEAVSCQIQTFTGDDLEVAEMVSDHLPVLAVFSTQNKYKDRE